MEEIVELIPTEPVVQSVELCSFCEYYLWISYIEWDPHETVGVPIRFRSDFFREIGEFNLICYDLRVILLVKVSNLVCKMLRLYTIF